MMMLISYNRFFCFITDLLLIIKSYSYELFMAASSRQILITSALPYANGAINIGHLVEYIQTDIWARHLRAQQHEVYYVGADDTHGTPIMLRAEKEGITPQALIARVQGEHKRDFDGFLISFDHYGSTDCDENKALAGQIYQALRKNSLIEKRDIEQFFDVEKNMFLPDRFIKGECPKCAAKDQYGDSCEVCGATYNPTELKNPYSVVSGSAPTLKTSEHYFFKLSDARCVEFLRTWVGQLAQAEAKNKMKEWLVEGQMGDWDISRDAPYFGFEIPDAPGKFFYVWLDAPVGYFASFEQLCKLKNMPFVDWIKPDTCSEMYHFIGKDILYFHTLFWPAMLEFSGFRTPTNVFSHGFLTVNGAKMSKSRGTFITAQSYLDAGMNPEWLRYYFATKLSSNQDDLDLNFDDFMSRVNSDLIGKYINIASRSAGFLHKYFDGKLIEHSSNPAALIDEFNRADAQVLAYFEQREYARATREIMRLADLINQYFDEQKPWELAKQTDDVAKRAQLHEVLSVAIRAFARMSAWLSPILPTLTERAKLFLKQTQWQADFNAITEIAPYEHLMMRVDPKQIEALIEANR
jgi:methionyl-tRNA synthetase